MTEENQQNPVTPVEPIAVLATADQLSETNANDPENLLVRAPDLTPDLLPENAAAFVMNAAARLGTAAAYVAIALLTGLAGLVGNSIRLLPNGNTDWQVSATLWGMLVGEPSQAKTPALFAGLNPITTLDEQLSQDYDRQKREVAANAILTQIKREELIRQVRRAVRLGEDEEALDLLDEAMGMDVENHRPRLIVRDVSMAKLAQLLGQHPTGLLMVQDELARLLARLLSRSHGEERGFYLEANTGLSPYAVDRIGREEIRIPALTLSIVGTIQPDKLRAVVADTKSGGGGGDGFLQRFQMAVWPEEYAHRDTIPAPLDQHAIDALVSGFADLYAFTRALKQPLLLRFSAGAQRIYGDWLSDFRRSSAKAEPYMRSYLVKLERTVCVLALINELLMGGREEVGEPALSMALRWEPFLAAHAAKIMSLAVQDPAALLVSRRDSLPEPFTARDAYRKQWKGLDKDTVDRALKRLERDGLVCRLESATGGRPSVKYRWGNGASKPLSVRRSP